jgi:TRAP-type C4-dicarboxylate transport system substrate-binding protein
MKKLACLSVAVLALIVGGTAPAPVAAQAKPIVWNLPHVAAPTYYHTINLNAFAAKVKEKSAGRMEIRVHPASSLYPQQEILPSLLDGRSEIGPVLSGYSSSSPSSPSSSARRGSSC